MPKIGKRASILSILAVPIFIATPCFAGVPLAIDSQEPSNVGHHSTTSPLKWNFTNLAGDEIFINCVVTNAGTTAPTVSTPTYAGVAATPVPGSLNHRVTANSTTIVAYHIDQPAVGTNEVSVAFSGAGGLDAICGAVSMRGVGSVGSAVSAQGAGTTASVSLGGTTSGDFVLSLVSSGAGVVSATAPNTTSFQLNVSQNTNGDNAALGQETTTSGGTVSPSFTVQNDNWIEDAWEVFGGGAAATGAACTVSPPPAASAAGLTKLNFCDDFNYADTSFIDFTGTNNKLWTAGLWFDPFGNPNSYSIGNSILTQNLNNADNGGFSSNLTTVHHDLGGGVTFSPPFYAEARVSGSNWFAFWFFSLTAARSGFVSGDPSTYTAEIDVIEGAAQHGTSAPTTLHRNTGGNNGIPDTQLDCFGNGPATGSGMMPNGGSNQRQYHTYAVLAQGAPGNVTWFVDGVQTCQVAAFDSTQNIYMMILAMTSRQGGIFNDTVVQPEVGSADWVRVWTH